MDDYVDSPLPPDVEPEAHGADERRPYEPPIIESGLAFEKVLLLSGCNSGFFCPVPC